MTNIRTYIHTSMHIQHIMYGLSPLINTAMTSKQTSVGHGPSLELSPGIPWSSLIWLRKRFLPYTGYVYTIYCQVAAAPKNAINKNLKCWNFRIFQTKRGPPLWHLEDVEFCWATLEMRAGPEVHKLVNIGCAGSDSNASPNAKLMDAPG